MYKEMVEGLTPEVVEKEMILDGTNSNFRIIRQRYFVDTDVIDEVFVYKNNAKSSDWTSLKNHYFEEGKVDVLETFRSWSISNHPTQPEIIRKAYLLELRVSATEVRVTLIIRHFYDSGFKANIDDNVYSRVGDDRIQYEYKGEILNERQYWDRLTEAGYTPYQLLDVRIIEMDNYGVFNTY